MGELKKKKKIPLRSTFYAPELSLRALPNIGGVGKVSPCQKAAHERGEAWASGGQLAASPQPVCDS